MRGLQIISAGLFELPVVPRSRSQMPMTPATVKLKHETFWLGHFITAKSVHLRQDFNGVDHFGLPLHATA